MSGYVLLNLLNEMRKSNKTVTCSLLQSPLLTVYSALIPTTETGNFVCFVASRPKSTAMVIAGRSDHLSTLFPGQA